MNYAQTNLQLYRQLWSLGHTKDDILAVQQAYEFGMEIFAGQFRPTNKPFLCHLIGTASILVSLREPMTVVIAGLLHAIYTHGEFGDGTRGMSPNKTKKVREKIGETSETLIAHYTGQSWDSPNLLALQKEIHNKKSPIAYSILTIRLADVLEDSLDFGMEASRKQKFFGENGSSQDHIIKIAKGVASHLGRQDIANAFDRIYAENMDGNPLPNQESFRTSSFVLAPKSFNLKITVRLRRKFQRHLTWLRNSFLIINGP